MDDERQPGMPPTNPPERPAIEATSAPSPTFAPLPNLRPGRQPFDRRRALIWLGGVIALVVVVAGAAGALNLSGRLRGARTSHHPSAAAATATAQAAGAGQQFTQVSGIAFDSSTDGWILSEHVSENTEATSLYHYANGALTKLDIQQAGAGFNSGMWPFAPDNLWLWSGAGAPVFQYDGRVWTQQQFPAPQGTDGVSGPIALTMVSPTEGWAASNTFGATSTGAQILKNVFYHFNGQTWILEPADKQAAMGQIGDATPQPDQGGPSNQIQLTSISAGPGGDVWATANFQSLIGQNASNVDETGYLYHRVNGVWHVARVAPHTEYDGILMTGPRSGWITGQRLQIIKGGGSIPFVTVSYTPAVWGWDGATWSPAHIPQPTAEQAGMHFIQLAGSSPSDVWALGAANSVSVSPGSAYASNTDYLIHYDGARWSTVALPRVAASAHSAITFHYLSLTPTGELWIEGDLSSGPDNDRTIKPMLYHYVNGQWANAALPKLS